MSRRGIISGCCLSYDDLGIALTLQTLGIELAIADLYDDIEFQDA